jgi:hypothetical protein
MERYIAQKAQQALEALTTDEPLEQRLKTARMHFSFVTIEHYLRSAPSEVRQYLGAIQAIADDEPLPDVARKVREAIGTVFEQLGRENRPTQA